MLAGACLLPPGSVVAEDIKHVLRCESDGFAPRSCYLPVAPRDAEIKEIRMVEQLSSKPCREGSSWSANESEIIVRKGCRADFLIVYRVRDRFDHRERWRHDSDSRRRPDRFDHSPDNSLPQYEEDPNDIVKRAFEDIYNRRPSREELRFYRNLIINHGWTERQVRRDLRYRGR